ncbi:helix-hairpin-helix domain-containing protein [Staphylococcus succinus]|uniref:helix-hairpin-helix domain-containing protein n=2 Tax=Staphylococcus succinus TaxID=61015 RepID=UPI001F54721C|nr:helix-hairpin-helix domain-containing protein [Staphylococcus succinus]MEB7461332.1 helix-hairpin-helix domain-containing protein [Staphylococcus succinus]
MFNQWDILKGLIIKNKLLITILAISIVALLLIISQFIMTKDYGSDFETYTDKSNDNIATSSKPSSTKEGGLSNSKRQVMNEHNIDSVFVDIKGAVKHPNVYEMKSTDRVKQLLDKAVVTKNADLNKVNLAEKLSDQKLIYIPEKGESEKGIFNNHNNLDNSKNNTSRSMTANDTLNLNQVTETELLSIPGIGPMKAKSIIEYREEHGSFDSVEQLKEIKGIGDKTFEKLSGYFTV